jgi:predicted RNA binding protein YcfA (HicA-like mRNA interferase family)
MSKGRSTVRPNQLVKTLKDRGCEIVRFKGDHVVLRHRETRKKVQVPGGGVWSNGVPHLVIAIAADVLGISLKEMRGLLASGRRRPNGMRP